MDEGLTDDDFCVILSEDGDDRSTSPTGELYCDHIVLMDMSGCRIAEWRKEGDDFPVFNVVGTDCMPDDVCVDMSGYHNASDAIRAAKEWAR